MRLLITGGSGFIGRNLVESLRLRHDVLAPGRAELDLSDAAGVRRWLRAHPVDAVIHSATTPGHRNAAPVLDLASRNLRMYFGLIENRDSFGRLIVLGSGAEYGADHYRPRMSESYFGENIPADPSAFSKFVMARFAEASDRIVHLRPFGVFGKYEAWQIRFISNAICRTLFGLPITLRQNRRFDYIYVDDLGGIVEHFLTHDAAHACYNACADEAVELLAIAEMVREVAGGRSETQVATAGLGLEYSGDNRRLRDEMPELRLTPLRTGIERLYGWYVEHKSLIQRDALLEDQ